MSDVSVLSCWSQALVGDLARRLYSRSSSCTGFVWPRCVPFGVWLVVEAAIHEGEERDVTTRDSHSQRLVLCVTLLLRAAPPLPLGPWARGPWPWPVAVGRGRGGGPEAQGQGQGGRVGPVWVWGVEQVLRCGPRAVAKI